MTELVEEGPPLFGLVDDVLQFIFDQFLSPCSRFLFAITCKKFSTLYSSYTSKLTWEKYCCALIKEGDGSLLYWSFFIMLRKSERFVASAKMAVCSGYCGTNVDLMKFLHKNFFEANSRYRYYAYGSGRFWFWEHVILGAVKKENLPLLSMFLKIELGDQYFTIFDCLHQTLIPHGSIDLIKRLMAMDLRIAEALRRNDDNRRDIFTDRVDVLQFLFSNGLLSRSNDRVFEAALEFDSTKLLEFVLDNGFSLSVPADNLLYHSATRYAVEVARYFAEKANMKFDWDGSLIMLARGAWEPEDINSGIPQEILTRELALIRINLAHRVPEVTPEEKFALFSRYFRKYLHVFEEIGFEFDMMDLRAPVFEFRLYFTDQQPFSTAYQQELSRSTPSLAELDCPFYAFEFIKYLVIEKKLMMPRDILELLCHFLCPTGQSEEEESGYYRFHPDLVLAEVRQWLVDHLDADSVALIKEFPFPQFQLRGRCLA